MTPAPAGRGFRRGLWMGLGVGVGLTALLAGALALVALGVMGRAAMELFLGFVDLLWGH